MKQKTILYSLLLTSFTTFLSQAQNQVTTVSGSTQGFIDASLTSSKYNAPTGMCISPDGNLIFVADYSGNRIRKINISANSVTTIAGNGTAGFADGIGSSAQLSYPSGVELSSDAQFLYVADNGNSLIRKIDLATNTVTTIAGDGNFAHLDHVNGLQASFNQPGDLRISGDSVLYISDTENHVIRKMNLLTTAVSTIVGIAGVGGFLDAIGTSAAVKNPAGLALSADGSILFLADNGNHLIRKINLTTLAVTTVCGDGTQGYADNANGLAAKFYAPQGVAIDKNDPNILFISDTYNHRIRKVNLTTSAVVTVAGHGDIPPQSTFADNANGLMARFFYPIGCVVSPNSQDLFVADQGNFRIRKVKTGSTLAVETEAKQLLSVFPNPFSSTIHLENAPLEYEQVTIYDLSGKVLASFKADETISLASLNPGFYFLKLLDINHTTIFSEKIIKE